MSVHNILTASLLRIRRYIVYDKKKNELLPSSLEVQQKQLQTLYHAPKEKWNIFKFCRYGSRTTSRCLADHRWSADYRLGTTDLKRSKFLLRKEKIPFFGWKSEFCYAVLIQKNRKYSLICCIKPLWVGIRVKKKVQKLQKTTNFKWV